ncbi:MAG: EAL domain-containing protein [Candidatus Competibacteraceae bacterium]|nr:EAL domain-containing protein [Candidatus Competibacteraceae bacterium]
MTFPGLSRTGWLGKIGLFLALPAFAFLLSHAEALYRWDFLIYDWNLAAWSRSPPDDIVIVAIDEQSLRQLGRWPWSRRTHAALVRKLSEAGAKAIALDIVFAEPDATDPSADEELAAALAASGRAVLPVLGELNRAGGQLVETLPLPILANAVAGIGHVSVDLDPDSIARSVYLKAGLGSPFWPTLALALLESAKVSIGEPLPGQRAGGAGGPSPLPSSPYVWRRDYRVLIPFAGPPGHFRHFSYSEVLEGKVNPASFRDRYVLVGSTASGMDDALPTPVSGLTRPMSGVEFNANVLDALRQGLTIRPLSDGWTLLLTGLLVLLPLALYAVFPPRWALPLAGLGMLFTVAVSFGLLHGAQLWFPPAAALLAQGLSYPLWSWERLLQAVRSVFEKEQLAQVTLRSIGDAVITTDARGNVQYLNPVAESMLGKPSAALRRRPLGAIFQVADERDGYAPVDLVAECLTQSRLISLPEPSILINPDGREYAIRASAAPLLDQRGRLSGVVIAFGDVTEARRLSQQMVYQATHDALTQLPNLNLLRDRLKQAVARAQRAGCSLALLFIDLDHFKKINDGFGLGVGDTLLQTVALRLLECARKQDTIARVGGDEFICVLEDLQQEDRAVDFATKILNVLQVPFRLESHECFITASIGICLFPKDGGDVDTLLKNADTAMSRAKENGRNNIQFYSRDMHVRILERLTMEQHLRYALERCELELFYQPQMDLRQNRIIGVEALLRWRHPQRGWVPPLEFVPLAEETGLIEVIGEWVLETACRQAKTWQRQGLPSLRMAVNMSPRQFLRPGIVERVSRILRETGLEPHLLDLEITESLLMKDVEVGIATMRALKAIGVRLSIDDFGIGYSSLNYLKQFPIDQLKIDKSFLGEIATSRNDAAITLAMIAMAHSMRLTVIAEGVENETQLAFLRANRCDEIQGYHLSCPVPAHEFVILLQKEPDLTTS